MVLWDFAIGISVLGARVSDQDVGQKENESELEAQRSTVAARSRLSSWREGASDPDVFRHPPNQDAPQTSHRAFGSGTHRRDCN